MPSASLHAPSVDTLERGIVGSSSRLSTGSADEDNITASRVGDIIAESVEYFDATSQTICPLGGWDASGEVYPGHVVGGGASVFLEPGSQTLSNGQSLYIRCNWTGLKEDEVLKPGGTMGSISVLKGSSVPDDDVPTVTSLSGEAYFVLFSKDSNGEIVSNGCGTILIGFCPGGFIKERSG